MPLWIFDRAEQGARRLFRDQLQVVVTKTLQQLATLVPKSTANPLRSQFYFSSSPHSLFYSIDNTELPSVVSYSSKYNLLVQACRRQCGELKSRKVLDEMPHRVFAVLTIGKIIHGQSLKIGVGSNGLLGNAIIDLYAKCGNAEFAENAFSHAEKRDIIGWNSVLSMYSRKGLPERVLRLFVSIKTDDLFPNEYTYSIVFSACARMVDVIFGKQVHCDAVKVGFERSSFCEGSVIDMYAKCGHLFDARRVFDRAVNPDTVSWTAMIAGYAQSHLLEEGIKLFEQMMEMDRVPDQVTFVTAISAYARLGKLNEANNLFSQIPSPNVVAWNVMISGHAQKGNEMEALKFFQSMRKASVKSTRSTLSSVLSAIAGLGELNYGLLIHAEAIKQGLSSNVYVGSSLMNMYAKCEHVATAKEIFYSLEERNLITWNAMLAGYVQNGHATEVIELFWRMSEDGFQPDEHTYPSILSACASLDDLEAGCQLHGRIIKEKLASNLFVGNALVDMYAKCGSLVESRNQFERMKNRDVISWNAIISGFVQEKDEDQAFDYFRQMNLSNFVPHEVALASILSGCANVQALGKGEQVHCLSVKSGLDMSLYSGSSLVDMYVKCGDVRAAREVFKFLPKRSVVSMNAIIAGYAKNDNTVEAVNLLKEMQITGLNPSIITFVSLLDACDESEKVKLGGQLHCLILKSGLWYYEDFLGVSLIGMYMNTRRATDAHKLFSEFPGPKSSVIWTAMISGYNQNENNVDALQCFREMQNDGIIPDQATFVSVLKASAVLSSLRDGSQIHCIIFHTGFDLDESTSGALVDMYAKCGDVFSSSQVFKEMTTKSDVISWNSMIGGFAKNGFAEKAMEVFDRMKQSNVLPDDVTFISVLTACSHAGKVGEGRSIYNDMVEHYKIQPRVSHHTCMVDLFGRWGFLKEAEAFIEKLELDPDPTVWAALLGSCRLHGDEIRGKRAAQKLIESEPHNSAPYILLCNMYAESGNWHEVNSLRREMREKGVKKLPGCSWIVVDEKINLFVAGDESHTNATQIHSVLKDLTASTREEESVAETDCVVHGVYSEAAMV